MSTNYNVVPREPKFDPEILHLGKSCFKRPFLFQGYEFKGRKGLDSYAKWLGYIVENDLVIVNEYDEVISLEDFITLVKESSSQKPWEDDGKTQLIDGYYFAFDEFC